MSATTGFYHPSRQIVNVTPQGPNFGDIFNLRAFQTHSMSTLFKLFSTYVRPLLEYCTPLWSPVKIVHKEKIEKVQKRFTNAIFSRNGLYHVSYKERLATLGENSLKLRKILYDQNLVFKIFSGCLDIDKREIFNFLDFTDRTRGHPFRIFIGRVRSQQFFGSFLVRAVRTWNSLPNAIVSSSTPANFNHKLEAHLKQSGFF